MINAHFCARRGATLRLVRPSEAAGGAPPPLIAQNHFAARVLGAHKFFQLPAPDCSSINSNDNKCLQFYLCSARERARTREKRAFLYIMCVHALGMKFTNALCAHQNWFSLTNSRIAWASSAPQHMTTWRIHTRGYVKNFPLFNIECATFFPPSVRCAKAT